MKQKQSKKNSKKKRWVVKAGSNMICSGGPLLIRAWMQQVASLKKRFGIEVIWVTSGAIATATERTGIRRKNRLLPEKQALSAIGQPLIMDLYMIALQNVGALGGQILLTYDDLEDKVRLSNFQRTVETLLSWDVVPVLNENDAVATEEIKFGDNDSLSARVARFTQSDRLVILTDVLGLYDSNPKINADARLIRRVDEVTQKLLRNAAPQPGSDHGTGGMFSKLKAASYAGDHSIETWLVKGDIPQALVQIAENQPIGTMISAKKKNRMLRK